MKTILLVLCCISFSFASEKSISTTDGGTLKFYNVECYSDNGEKCDIIIEKYTKKNTLHWKARIGGSSWDYVESVLEVEDGFLVLGNTSSYGKGNLDVYVTKLSKDGKEQWFRTYGGFFNDYGRSIEPSGDEDGGFIIKGEKQHCLKEKVSQDCYLKPLLIKINSTGDNLYDNY